MSRRWVEIYTGIFMVIGLACVAYLTIKLGKMEVIRGDYQEIGAQFTTVSGLKTGASVETAGVPIGKVDRIELRPEDQVAVVWMKLNKNLRVYDDGRASIRTSGLIGDKYINLDLGGSEMGTVLAAGEILVDNESAVDIQEVISKYAFASVENGETPASAPQEEELEP